MLRITRFTCILFLLAQQAPARQDLIVCGTNHETAKEQMALHRALERRLRAAPRPRAQGIQPRSVARDIGNIAVIDDSDGVVARRNPFTLSNKLLRFTPTSAAAAAYRYEVADGGFDADAAANGTPITGLGDDDSRKVTLPFSFPFYGRSYPELYVNSDGNITFTAPDDSTADRSLGRLTSGVPRIAPLYRDLNPSAAPNSVRVAFQGTQVAISWFNVPEYQSFGTGLKQTFQVRLYNDGRIEFAFQTITTSDAVTGIAPGDLAGVSEVVAFANDPSGEYSGAVAERFSSSEEVDYVFAAQKFYETHEDAYDYLVIYNNLDIAAAPGAVAFEITVRSRTDGVGDTPVQEGPDYGSPRRLQAVLQLGKLSQYPSNPNSPVPTRSSDTALTVLGHEAGHLFLALASVRDPGNPDARPMLGRQLAHWAFTFNSEASFLEGNRIKDNGPGAIPRFVTTGAVEGYSALDQYLMGFRPAWEVPPTFLVTGSSQGASVAPRVGVTMNGSRRDITIDEIISAEGRRTPDWTVAQHHFRMAFILVTAAGVEPTQAELDKVEAYRSLFPALYLAATNGRATIETTLKHSLDLSLFPAVGLPSGGAAETRITLHQPTATPLTVQIQRANGLIDAPASVTVPAGMSEVSFGIHALGEGVEDITAVPDDDSYETAYAHVQVSAPADLRLDVVSGAAQKVVAGEALPEPVVVKLTDINKVPYPGQTLSAKVTDGGTVQPASAITDANGVAQFTWTPAPGPFNQMTVSLGEAPRVVVTALGKPTISQNGVVNAASYQPGLVPGGIASLFGASLAGGQTIAATAPLTTVLGGVTVRINGTAATILYLSDTQINFVVPSSTAVGEADIVVSVAGENSDAVKAPVLSAQPGTFVVAAPDDGAVLTAGTGKLTSVVPSSAGDVLEIYCTGLGAVHASTQYPGLFETNAKPVVTVGGQSAEVIFSGLAPNFVGLYQVNVKVPTALAAGPQPLNITVEGAAGNEVRVYLK